MRQASAIMESYPALMKHAFLKGEVDDELMQRLVDGHFNYEDWMVAQGVKAKVGGMALKDHSLNRRRCIWLNHEGTAKRRQAVVDAKAAAEANKEAEKVRKEEIRKRKAEDAEEKQRKKVQKQKEFAARLLSVPRLPAATAAPATAGKHPKQHRKQARGFTKAPTPDKPPAAPARATISGPRDFGALSGNTCKI